MKKKGHAVSLLTGSAEGIPSRYAYKGVNIYRTPLFDLNWLAKRGINGLEREIRKVYIDFIDTFRCIGQNNYFVLKHFQKTSCYCYKCFFRTLPYTKLPGLNHSH